MAAQQIKFTGKRGLREKSEVTVEAGSAESQTDTISINIDFDEISKGEALILIDEIKAAIFELPWPAIEPA
jgi:hypothetical protein